MVILKANQDSEAGKLPPPVFEKIGNFNEELVNAGSCLLGKDYTRLREALASGSMAARRL
jgi:hypothetical protein